MRPRKRPSEPMSVPIIVSVKCHSCQQFYDPREVISVANVHTCQKCWEWHEKAIQQLVTATGGCPECRRSHDEIGRDYPNGEPEYVLVPKDGIYQLLCRRCEEAYALQRKEMFVGTEHGADVLKL